MLLWLLEPSWAAIWWCRGGLSSSNEARQGLFLSYQGPEGSARSCFGIIGSLSPVSLGFWGVGIAIPLQADPWSCSVHGEPCVLQSNMPETRKLCRPRRYLKYRYRYRYTFRRRCKYRYTLSDMEILKGGLRYAGFWLGKSAADVPCKTVAHHPNKLTGVLKAYPLLGTEITFDLVWQRRQRGISEASRSHDTDRIPFVWSL